MLTAATMPTDILRLVADARSGGWTVSYPQTERGDAHGLIRFEHPGDFVRDCSIEFPMPEAEIA